MKQTNIKDLKFDSKNANKHTQQGMKLLEKSLQTLGFGRSVVADKNNNLIAGNGVVEAAGQVGMDKIKIVETDGSELIVVKRTDIDINSKKGRELAIADNQTAKVGIDFDFEVLNDLSTEFDLDLKEWDLELDFGGVTNEENELSDNYTHKVGAVVYEPKNTNHIPIDLFSFENNFQDKINKIENKDLKLLFQLRSAFFTQFNFSKIADYYAYQATPVEKELFESLGLVLLDKDGLIQNGFSDLLERINDNDIDNEVRE